MKKTRRFEQFVNEVIDNVPRLPLKDELGAAIKRVTELTGEEFEEWDAESALETLYNFEGVIQEAILDLESAMDEMDRRSDVEDDDDAGDFPIEDDEIMRRGNIMTV